MEIKQLSKDEVQAMFNAPESLTYLKGSHAKRLPDHDEIFVDEVSDIPEARITKAMWEAGEVVCPFHSVLTDGTDEERMEYLSNLNIPLLRELMDELKASQEYEGCQTLKELISEYFRLFPERILSGTGRNV